MTDSRLAHGPTLLHGDGMSGPPADSGPAGSSSGRADSGDDLAAGAQVGEYVVERFLGAGAMGEVYAGVHPVIGKKVAIKVLKRSVAATPDGAERFKREARAAGQVDHPRVVDVFAFGRLDDGRLYLVMDLVVGRSLRQAITAGPLPEAMALEVLAQIADALDAAHGKGVVHRDLKPDNVMLAGDAARTTPEVFVLDFGLAKLLAMPGPDGTPVAQASMLTGQGTWLGTPSYMAPEQWSADGAGPASDRYALGVMAFELLSGSVPFEAQSLPQMMEQHFRAKVPALTARGAVASSSKFDPIVARAMAKDPDARFTTATAMIDALQTAAGSKHTSAPTGTAKRYVPAVLGIGVLVLSIGAVLSLRRPPEQPAAPPLKTQPAIATGKVRIDLDSMPHGAEIHRGNLSLRTPTYLDVDEGERIALDIRKPGYEAMHREVTAAAGMKLAPFQLVAIEGYEGIWMLPSGELRSFHRVGDRVEVFKRTAVDAEPVFFHAYDLMPAATGVTFATTETIHQPGKPAHPSCYLPYTTEYHYEPASDELTVRRARIIVDVIDDACVAGANGMTDPERLARADRRSGEAVETLAPVGHPITRGTKQAVAKQPNKVGKAAAPTDNQPDTGGQDSLVQNAFAPAPSLAVKPTPQRAPATKGAPSQASQAVQPDPAAQQQVAPPVKRKAASAKKSASAP